MGKLRRQKRIKKIKMPSFLEDAKEAVLGKIVIIFVAIVFLFTLFVLGKAFLYRSDYFRLRTVETRSPFFDQKTAHIISSQILSAHHGRNIFRINLKNISDMLQATYPDAKEVSVRIVLPDKLAVVLRFRKPVAIVRGERPCPIDEEGFVLPSMDVVSLRDLPVIEGVAIRYDERRGKKSASKNLGFALELLRSYRESRLTHEYGIISIDAGEIKNLSFLMRNGLKVIIGSENFAERLALLEKTLKDPRLAVDRIGYIDVRFEDAVIGPK